mgnify:CR=1 FL=1
MKSIPLLDIFKMLAHKHQIQVYDYYGLFGGEGRQAHIERYEQLTGDKDPIEGYPDYSGNHPERRTVVRNGQRVPATQAEYDADLKLIHAHYQRYVAWEKDNPAPEYCNYWHWILEEIYGIGNIKNPCTRFFPVTQILNDKETPDWVREITQKIHDEYKDSLTKAGSLRIRIKW